MPVRFQRRWALLLAAGCLCGVTSGAVLAQEPAPTTPAAPAEPAQTETRPADLQVLAKAFGDLMRTPALEARTETRMSGTGQGFSFTSRQQHHVTVTLPYRFRAETAMVKEDNAAGAKYIAVSNGAKVITYRPGLKQYASVTRAAFDDNGDEVLVLGLYGALYFNRDLLKGFGAITPENQETVLQELRKDGTTLTGVTEMVEGRDLAMFTLFLAKEKITLRFRIDPRTSQIEELEMKVKEKNMDVTMFEKVLSRTPLQAPAAGTFEFTPPKGVKRVKSLSVEPF